MIRNALSYNSSLEIQVPAEPPGKPGGVVDNKERPKGTLIMQIAAWY